MEDAGSSQSDAEAVVVAVDNDEQSRAALLYRDFEGESESGNSHVSLDLQIQSPPLIF